MLNSFWIELPILYALTVGGLVSGYRRGGVPPDRRWLRALLAGLPVMVGLMFAWAIICGVVGPRRADVGPALSILNSLLTLLFVLSASALAGSILARRDLFDIHKRGTVLLDETEQGPRVVDPEVLTIAGYPLTLLDETKHFKILGTTGTGKSTLIRELLTKALSRGDRAVIADPDGGYAARFYNPERGDVILSPFDARAARWDLFAEMTQPQDADHLARSFIADQDGEEQVWRGFARTYVSCLLRQLHLSGQQCDLGRLFHLLSIATEEDLRGLLQGTAAARFLGNREGGKFLQSVQSVASQHLAAIEHLARQSEGELFSIRRWIREGRGVLFLPYHANEIPSLGSLISAWMRLAIFETLSGPESDQRIWFVVDELDALGAIDGLKDALTRLRKFGGRCILGLQSIAQVRGAFGDAQAQSIVENCGNTVIFRCSASERGGTAEFASRLIGERQIVRKQTSMTDSGFFSRGSRTISEQVQTEDAVMASEIEQLPDLHGFLKLASQPQWRRATLTPPEEGRT
jgi:type IV secretory pathway TraG/TraD family ATPase VirD4